MKYVIHWPNTPSITQVAINFHNSGDTDQTAADNHIIGSTLPAETSNNIPIIPIKYHIANITLPHVNIVFAAFLTSFTSHVILNGSSTHSNHRIAAEYIAPLSEKFGISCDGVNGFTFVPYSIHIVIAMRAVSIDAIREN